MMWILAVMLSGFCTGFLFMIWIGNKRYPPEERWEPKKLDDGGRL